MLVIILLYKNRSCKKLFFSSVFVVYTIPNDVNILFETVIFYKSNSSLRFKESCLEMADSEVKQIVSDEEFEKIEVEQHRQQVEVGEEREVGKEKEVGLEGEEGEGGEEEKEEGNNEEKL